MRCCLDRPIPAVNKKPAVTTEYSMDYGVTR